MAQVWDSAALTALLALHLVLSDLAGCLAETQIQVAVMESGGGGGGGCNVTQPVFECPGTTDAVCVSLLALCNGIPDCPGGQDESVQQCGCLANEFSCSNSCVPLVHRCDRRRDCPQAEDEQDCNTYLCPMTHFKCNNHFCVPLHAVCDFSDDCGDNSDETNCPHRPCWNKEFRCDSGQCLRPGELCDGRPDCGDQSDEKSCQQGDFVECGDGTRVHRYYWCDHWPDCASSHLDETNCGACNESYEFQCPNGRCIRRANVCDSQCDCAPPLSADTDMLCADELDCGQFYSLEHGIAMCRVGEALSCSVPAADPKTLTRERCIRQQFLCDGHNDCQNGLFLSDEFGCGGKESFLEDTFECQDKRTLPAHLRCDFKPDCMHGDDELNCTRDACGRDQFQCASGQCVDRAARCDLLLDCLDKTDELQCSEHECGPGFNKCLSGGQCVPISVWCDHRPDCPDSSDENHCEVRLCWPAEYRCSSGQCVSAALRCVVPLDPRAGCADRSNLADCQEWRCAEDQFKCRGGSCLHHSLVCDGHIHCPAFWDDEDNCSFTCSQMAEQCECSDVHINCTDRGLAQVPLDAEKEITWFHLGSNNLNKTINNHTFTLLDRLIYLDMSNTSLWQLPAGMFATLWQLSVLDLTNNRLTRLANGSFTGLATLKGLHLKGNQLEVLESLAFYGLTSLKTLDLSRQNIKLIEPGAFVGLRSLNGLDLSHNQIAYLEQGSLRGMPHLIFLVINGNNIQVIEPTVFLNVPAIDKLVTDEFRFCCLARHARVCLPPPDEFSSCEDLMSNLVLRLCVWLLAGVAIVGNIVVIVCRSRYSYCNQVHSFLITNLALGDLLMGTYLLMIALVDRHYRGVYFIHDSSWRSSRLCALAGFISTFSSELSVFTLTVITLDRFLVIIFPFRVRRLEMTRTWRLMTLGWLLAASLSALPLLSIDYFHSEPDVVRRDRGQLPVDVPDSAHHAAGRVPRAPVHGGGHGVAHDAPGRHGRRLLGAYHRTRPRLAGRLHCPTTGVRVGGGVRAAAERRRQPRAVHLVYGTLPEPGAPRSPLLPPLVQALQDTAHQDLRKHKRAVTARDLLLNIKEDIYKVAASRGYAAGREHATKRLCHLTVRRRPCPRHHPRHPHCLAQRPVRLMLTDTCHVTSTLRIF